MTVAFNAYAQTNVKIIASPMTARPGIASGTPILTQTGSRPIEAISIGDKVVTRDRGFQMVRWIDVTELRCGADSAPIHFQAGALGDHDAITVAANTRVLMRSALAKALFGETEVFAYAADLVNDTTIQALTDIEPLQMVHLLFDHHEILRAAEMEVESLHPDRALMNQLDDMTRDSILRLLPNSDAMMGYGYGPTARTCLRRSEARILCAKR